MLKLTLLVAMFYIRVVISTHAEALAYCQIMDVPEPLSKVISLQIATGPDCDLQKLEDFLELHKQPPKDEFETTKAYKERVIKNVVTTLSGRSLTKPYAIALRIHSDHIIYDADKQILNFLAPFFFIDSRYLDVITNASPAFEQAGSQVSDDMLIFLANHLDSSTYEAQNAFDAKFAVSKVTGDSWAIRIPSGPILSTHLPGIPLLPSSARVAKEHIYLVIAGNSPAVPTGSYHRLTEPSVDSPSDEDINIHYLRLSPSYAFVMRNDTGEVLQRMSYDSHGMETILPVGHNLELIDRQVTPETNLIVLSAVQRGAIGEKVRDCWTHGPSMLSDMTFKVHLIIVTDASGIARQAFVASNDPSAAPSSPSHGLAEKAIRAVLSPQCSSLPLPPTMLGKSQTLDFVFRP